MTAESPRTPNVISVKMTVDQMSDGLVGNLGDRLPNMRRERLRCIDDDYAAFVGHEHGLNPAIRDHVEPVTHLLGSVPLGGIDGWTLRKFRNIDVLVHSHADRRDGWHMRVWHTGGAGPGA